MADRPPFVDAHVHFWDRDLLRYPWLESPAMAAIGSTYFLGAVLFVGSA
jgi:predicted TIM-barrel fold metal-dependent hydrolase